MNKYLKIFLILIILLIIFLGIKFIINNKFISLKKQNDVKKIITDNEKVNIYIVNIMNGKKTEIDNYLDKESIIKNLEKINIKRINKNDAGMGGYCRFEIENVQTLEKININISKLYLSINNDKTYKVDIDIFDKLVEIVKKYDKESVL